MMLNFSILRLTPSTKRAILTKLFNTSTCISPGISKIHRYKNFSNSSEGGILLLKVKQVIILCSLFFLFIHANAQDLDYARKIVRELSAEKFHGRGYIRQGDLKAAKFLRKELQRLDIKPLVRNYFQGYIFTVNTFPGPVKLMVDNKVLIPGTEFTVRPNTPSIAGKFDLVAYDTTAYYSRKPGLQNKFALLDTLGWGKQWYKFAINIKKPAPYKGIIQFTNKTPGTGISTSQSNIAALLVRKDVMPENPSQISIDIKSEFTIHKSYNVLGVIPGLTDTFIVFTAHYDHLGRMGKQAYFPGANDNASGTAMTLDIAKFLAKSARNKYSVAFMFFSGEEAGLLGSEYYASNPVFPLDKIKIVINLDMVGTGIGGVSVFNGSSHPREFAALDSLNKTMNLGLNLKQKGPSQGSDHFSFHKRGVKALFLLTDDKNAPYHTTTDTYDQLSFDAYPRLFKLIQEYIKSL